MRLATLPFLCLWSAAALAAEPAAPIPDGFKLVVEQTFDDESSLKEMAFSDPKAWRWTQAGKDGGALELFQQSKYQTKFRSPFNIGLLANHRFGDFVMEADVLQTGKEYGHRDMCLFFGFQSPTEFYYTHLATKPDANAHNVFLVNNAARKSFLPIPAQGIDWGKDWKRLRLERIGSKIRVFFEDLSQPVLEGENEQFLTGGVGFGSFDDTGKIDNWRVWAKSSDMPPNPWFPPNPATKVTP